jgi:deazaflavin-dependent oxidoreductase (nitroreductase family)
LSSSKRPPRARIDVDLIELPPGAPVARLSVGYRRGMSSDPVPTDRRTRDDALMAELRANGGRSNDGNANLVILTTTGRKSGRQHDKPLCARSDGADVIIAGTAGGQPAHTQWYLNLVAEREVIIEFQGETYPAIATTVENSLDRDRLFALIGEEITGIYEYQDRCRDTRQIPIVRLGRV